MTTMPHPDTADQAARAARAAADEAPTPEARLFLREHANRLAQLAAARRRGLPPRDRAAVTAVVGTLVVRR